VGSNRGLPRAALLVQHCDHLHSPALSVLST
jgi:hypothetical protein